MEMKWYRSISKMDDTEGPVKTLRAFKRVRIPAGKTVEVKFSLDDTQLEWWDEQSNTMRVAREIILL